MTPASGSAPASASEAEAASLAEQLGLVHLECVRINTADAQQQRVKSFSRWVLRCPYHAVVMLLYQLTMPQLK